MFMRAQRLSGMGDVTVAALRWSNLQQQVLNQQPNDVVSWRGKLWPLYAMYAAPLENGMQVINIGGELTLVQPLFTEKVGSLITGENGWDNPVSTLEVINYVLGNQDRAGWGIMLLPGPNDTVLRHDFKQENGDLSFARDMVAFVAASVGMYGAITAAGAAFGGSAISEAAPAAVTDAAAQSGDLYANETAKLLQQQALADSGIDLLPTNLPTIDLSGAANSFSLSPTDLQKLVSTAKTAASVLTSTTRRTSSTPGITLPRTASSVTPYSNVATYGTTALMPAQQDNSMLWIAAAVVGALLIGS